MQLKTLCLPLLAFIFTFTFVSVHPVAAVYFPARLAEGLPDFKSSVQQYVFSETPAIHTEGVDLDNFWQRLRDLGDNARHYSDDLIKNKAAELSQEVRQKITELKERMAAVAHGATVLNDELHASAKLRPRRFDDDSAESVEDISGDLERAFEVVLEELKIMFPAPDQATGHEHRQEVVRVALEKAGAALVTVCVKYGMDEERVLVHWDKTVRPAIENMVVLLGDLAEQHPNLLEALLFSGAVMLIPNYWLLRPLLSLFGFGPIGPVKGTPAAWAQRVFFGAAVQKGNWFALLTKAAMTIKPPGWLGSLGGFFGISLGAGGVILAN
ncbi:hypothetical protein C8R44DRAFT_776488 [Mycena epipterygia]|nr:hypothetical protein C8R44DRAFT_776488 [Mycena epipterygia]